MASSRDRRGASDAPAGRAGWAHLAVVYVVWGSTYLAIRVAVRPGSGFPPFGLGALRMLLAGTLLLGWALLRRLPVRISRRDVFTLGAAGLLMLPLGNGLVNWAEQRTSSGYAALLVGALPIWTAILEAILDRRRPSLRLVVALAVGFGGLALLAAPSLAAAGTADGASVVALLVAPITWACGSVLQARRPVAVRPVVAAGYLHLFGGVGFAAIFFALGESAKAPSGAAWAAFAYLVVAGSVVAFTSFVRVLRLLPTRVVMTYAYVNPAIAVLLGALLLGERMTWADGAGMALILAGVWGVLGARTGEFRSDGGPRPGSA